jgi:hypothetical protein
MIKSISGNGHVQVTGSSGFTPYVNMSNPSAGMMRYNGTNQQLEVYDGMSWLTLTSDSVHIGLDHNATAALTWAMTKMSEEAELQRMAETHPAVLAAYEAFKRAGEQLKTTIILSKDEQPTS